MSESNPESINFQPGDIVQLKSLGPAMTVTETKEEGVHCLWYAEMSDEIKTHVIPAICLEKIDIDDAEDDEEEDDGDKKGKGRRGKKR
jgi:uncharacterized protein YodC (DUF2158 family)